MTRPFELGFREALMFSSGSSVIAAIERAGSLHRNSEKTQSVMKSMHRPLASVRKKGTLPFLNWNSQGLIFY